MEIQIREAKPEELKFMVELLSSDPLGAKREQYELPLPRSYVDAFERIQSDPNNLLIVALDNSKLIGVLQLTLIPHLTFRGGTRAQIEGVRVHQDYRSQGIGKKLFEWAIDYARKHDCHLVQLTTNKERERAQDFYQGLGFEPTHEGFKLYLKEW